MRLDQLIRAIHSLAKDHGSAPRIMVGLAPAGFRATVGAGGRVLLVRDAHTMDGALRALWSGLRAMRLASVLSDPRPTVRPMAMPAA